MQRQAEHEVDGTLILSQFSDFLASDECAQACVEVAGGDSEDRTALPVGLDPELRYQGLLVELGILKAGNFLREGLDLRADIS